MADPDWPLSPATIDWTVNAACKGKTKLFFPWTVTVSHLESLWENYCSTCPVLTECEAELPEERLEADMPMREGIRAGLTHQKIKIAADEEIWLPLDLQRKFRQARKVH